MRRWMTTFAVIAQCLAGCGSDSDAGGGAGGESATPDGAVAAADASVETDAAGEVCDLTTHRVNLPGPFECPRAPLTKTITGAGKTFEIFQFEASHPLATDLLAFPCAVSDGGEGFEAPAVPTPACSVKGVRPWHSVDWNEATEACAQTGDGWRLCSSDELGRACEGPDATTYTWGDRFDASKCNLREVYRADGAERTSEAPTGEFPACRSPEGVYDANGNLWEWVSDRDNSDPRRHTYLGAGWKIIAQRHDDSVQTCRTETKVPGISGETYSSGFVGFRCCRDR